MDKSCPVMFSTQEDAPHFKQFVALDLQGTASHIMHRMALTLFPILTALHPLSLADRARFALYGVAAHQDVIFPSIHRAFSSYAVRFPEAVAAEHLGERITYEELDDISTILSVVLRRGGISSGHRVCLLVKRSIAMLVGIFGILKSGASYIPLDGGIVTDEALCFILKNSDASLVLYSASFAQRVPKSAAGFCLEAFLQQPLKVDPQRIAILRAVIDVLPVDEAYVVYTSGTTGTPKGVSVTHRNVTNLLCTAPGNLRVRPGVKVAQLLNIAFDMGAWEILGCLMNGGTLCIRGSSKADWESVMRRANVVIATPTVLQAYDPAIYPNIKVVATAGEPCSQSLADRWSLHAEMYNCCGPTETTIVNTMHRHRSGEKLSIGVPTPNNRVYILDDDHRPVPVGSVGIMWAAGSCVSAGYIGLPKLTGQKYRPDHFLGDGYMFNTGDLGRWNENGQLMHLGRIDDQVKIKGFRVELQGISSVMEIYPGVAKAIALLVDKELWGFVGPSSVNMDDLHAFVTNYLPYYSVPCMFIGLEEFPVTSNGKVDQRELVNLAMRELERGTMFQTGQKGAIA